MVNLTVAGQELGIPYCTLCGSAQAFLTGELPVGSDRAVLRTTGMLSRSNKMMMYDLTTMSLLDTFTGEALSGPLHEAEVTLPQVSVVASTWGTWKDEHPDTRILAEDGGIDRSYPLDPLGGRDDDGPIFPVGPVELDGDGLRVLAGADDVASHQSFWFAWSQFHPDTVLWSAEVSG